MAKSVMEVAFSTTKCVSERVGSDAGRYCCALAVLLAGRHTLHEDDRHSMQQLALVGGFGAIGPLMGVVMGAAKGADGREVSERLKAAIQQVLS